MARFFSSLQGLFKADYGGRYLAFLFSEVCRQDPRPFQKFLARKFQDSKYKTGAITLDPEYSFRSRDLLRRADLAVRIDGELSALIELKFFDRLAPKSEVRPAQLTDYLRVCRQKSLDFLLLSREPLTNDESRDLKKHRQAQSHYCWLAEHLRVASHPASQMLFEFMCERDLTMEPLHQDHLYRFFHRFLKRRIHAGKIVSKDALSEGPAQFQALLSTMRSLASDMGGRVRESSVGGRSRAPTIDFEINSYVDSKRIRREVDLNTDDWGEIHVPEKARRGGRVYVFAAHPIAPLSSKWLYLEYGIAFEVSPGPNRKLRTLVFAQIYGQGFVRAGVTNTYIEKAIGFDSLAKPERRSEVLRRLHSVVRKSARAAVPVPVLTRAGRATLRKFASR